MGTVVAGLGAGLRTSDDVGGARSIGYLLSVAGLFLVVGSAAWRARVSEILLLFDPDGIRRRAILSLLAGMFAALSGCIAASAFEPGRYRALVQGVLEGMMIGGFGLGLAGFLTLAWVFGMARAGERIERLSDQDW